MSSLNVHCNPVENLFGFSWIDITKSLIKYAALSVCVWWSCCCCLRYHLDQSSSFAIQLYLLVLVYVLTFARICTAHSASFSSFSVGDFLWGISVISWGTSMLGSWPSHWVLYHSSIRLNSFQSWSDRLSGVSSMTGSFSSFMATSLPFYWCLISSSVKSFSSSELAISLISISDSVM